jgi:serine/threonine protein kinase
VEVVKFLHQKGYVHATGGLSMESIFSEGYMFTDVLLDIGQSANIGIHEEKEETLKHLLPPESLENPKNTEKGDIYSLGIIFFQMATLLVCRIYFSCLFCRAMIVFIKYLHLNQKDYKIF